ncbi:Sodium-coupled monocarboxylate transporter 1 [Temnothorax longispinosus]|uniref:Sodium-coupled monocarboxylate transporter 1 n=1 Tax=Temnothorax longispinosus TaxID=300112 RepID=A0A4V3S9R5_9HYME|nr:Sodium-coupled monocarboxylate transporter 1 [Temnothorax longispinosus]
MDWSPLTRHTIWGLTIGGFVHWLQITAINQNMIQRYLSLPTLQSAKRALWCFMIGVILLISICGYAGMLIYAWYYECDPLTTKLARAKDQLLPLLVMNVLGEFPGLPGLFVAGVFSAALSSLSTGLNSMAAVVLEDFVKPFMKTPFTRKGADVFMKLTVVILGTICVALVFVVEQAGTHMLQGALVGGIAGLSFMGWLGLSAEAAITSGKIKFDMKPVTTEGCTYSFPQVENLLISVPPDSILDNDLDFTVFGPLKIHYNQAVSHWMVNNPGKTFGIYDIASVLGLIYPHAFSTNNIVNDFRVSGICPINMEIVLMKQLQKESMLRLLLKKCQDKIIHVYFKMKMLLWLPYKSSKLKLLRQSRSSHYQRQKSGKHQIEEENQDEQRS